MNQKWFVLFALAIFAASCATDTAPGDDQSNNDEQDMAAPPEDMGGGNNTTTADMATPVDMAMAPDMPPDMAPTEPWEYCVLDTEDPWGDCVTMDELDFGMSSQNAVLTATARFTNLSGNNIIVRRIDVLNPEVSVAPGVYDTATPPVWTDAPLAFELVPDASIFLQITVDIGSRTGLLGGSIDMWVSRGADDEENVPLAYRVEVQDCPQDTADCDGNPANGCETNVLVNSEHCGMCGNACDLANSTSTCNAGECVVVTCDPGFQSCDTFTTTGCETNTDTDLANCGGCGMPCMYDNAMTSCGMGMCNFDGCDPDWHDLDMDLATNGCEYNCVFQSATDSPDDLFGDENCDGIDGDISKAVFVAADGNDAFPGTMDQPVRSIAEAISVVQATNGLEEIYVSAGDYPEHLVLADGISIYGGYERANGWQRSGAIKPRIINTSPSQGRIVAVSGLNVSALTVIDRMTIEASAIASQAGVSNYGIHCRNCNGLLLQNTDIVVGNAADGSPGSNGEAGLTAFGRGYQGDPGQNGDEDKDPGNGGAAGASDCGRPGGAGGRGGAEGDNTGLRGGNGAGSASNGGPGGSGGNPGRAGSNGGNGAAGSAGSNGPGGNGGAVTSFFWAGDDGTDGGTGTHGVGGGGGGGGGGQGCTFCNDGGGNGGGAGGGAGCHGLPATGGTAGGSAFGIFLITSNGFALERSTITVGDGGNGGVGGAGGAGSPGGAGSLGATHKTDEIGAGGNGGSGGTGGRGGHGGGGAGGNSFGIYLDATTVTIPANTTVTVGTAGNGGTSPGPASSDGADGVAAATN